MGLDRKKLFDLVSFEPYCLDIKFSRFIKDLPKATELYNGKVEAGNVTSYAKVICSVAKENNIKL